MSQVVGTKCPYCKTEITGDEPRKICPFCGAAHHPKCWEAKGGCSAEGCSGSASRTVSAPASPANSSKPRKTTAEKRRKRIRRIIATSVALVLIAAAGVYFYIDNQRQIEDSYMTVVNDYVAQLKTNGELLKPVGEKTKAEWYVFLNENDDIYPTLKNMVDEVQFYYRADIDKIEAANITIESNYGKLQKPPSHAEKYQQIMDAATAIHDSYMAYFNTVLHYSGSYNSFCTDFPAAAEDFKTKYDALESLLAE